MRVLNVNYEKCTGCRLCEMACSLGHFTLFSHWFSRIRVLKGKTFFHFYPQFCTQCGDAYCVRACPTGALEKKFDLVHYDRNKCILCRQCTFACPWGLIYPDPEMQFMIKCDLCGGDPECVKVCLQDAITFVDVEEGADIKQFSNVNKMEGGR
jgi:Fe-S-cluster-containing hydrogenase component 2